MSPSTVFLIGLPALTALAPAALAASLASPIIPDFAAATFERDAAIDNAYFPLVRGRSAQYVGRGVDEGEPFEEVTNLKALRRPGPKILGVRTRVQEDKTFENGLLVERSFDYFAQDTTGNVWYLGEDTTDYFYDDNGDPIGSEDEGWRAGLRGAKAGWIMPGAPTIGQSYYQEYAPNDDELDYGENHAVLDRLRVDGVTYANVLQVLSHDGLDPEDLAFRYYAQGVGLIRIEEGLDGNLQNPELVLNRTAPAPVPLPAPAALLLTGLAGLFGLRRRRKAAL